MKRTASCVLLVLAAAGCFGTGATHCPGRPSQAIVEMPARYAVVPDPIEEAIRTALGGKSRQHETWRLGPDLTSGQSLRKVQERRTSVEVLPPDSEKPLKETAPPTPPPDKTEAAPEKLPPQMPAPVPPPPAPLFPGYRLAVGDVLDIVVSGDPDLSGRALVRRDGKIALPGVLMLIDAAGRTVEELTQDIRTSLYGAYLKVLPKISVEVMEGPNFCAIGVIADREFVRIPLAGDTRTLKSVLVLLLARIKNADALDLRNVTIIEPSRTYSVDAPALLKQAGADGYLPPGSVIVVSPVFEGQPSASAQGVAGAKRETGREAR